MGGDREHGLDLARRIRDRQGGQRSAELTYPTPAPPESCEWSVQAKLPLRVYMLSPPSAAGNHEACTDAGVLVAAVVQLICMPAALN